MIFDPIERMLWGISITISLICAFIYFHMARKREKSNDTMILVGWACIFLCLAIARTFFFLSDLQIQGKFISQTFYGDFTNYKPAYELLTKCGYTITLIGITVFVFSFEKVIKKTKFLITIVDAVFIVVIIIVPYKIASYIMSFIFPVFNSILIICLFFVFTKWSPFEFRAISSLFFMGFLFIFLSLLFYNQNLKNYNKIPLFIAPTFSIIGFTFALIPIIINPQFITHPIKFWYIFGLSTIAFASYILGLFLILQLPLIFILLGGLVFFVFVLIFFLTVRMIKADTLNQKRDDGPDFLGIFAKPKKITEEEVTISKEKKICLVCKTKLSRLLYMCPECSALYCTKCANALIDLENTCWVCETAIDETKPTKPTPFKEEEPKDEKSVHKNPKKSA